MWPLPVQAFPIPFGDPRVRYCLSEIAVVYRFGLGWVTTGGARAARATPGDGLFRVFRRVVHSSAPPTFSRALSVSFVPV